MMKKKNNAELSSLLPSANPKLSVINIITHINSAFCSDRKKKIFKTSFGFGSWILFAVSIVNA